MDETEELFPFYALGALSDDERARVEAYVAANTGAQARLNEMMGTTSALAYEAAPVEPSPALKKSLMERVNADARARRSRSRAPAPVPPRAAWLPRLVAAFSLIVAVAAGGWALSVSREVARLQLQTEALRQELETQRGALAQIASPDAQVFAIAGTEHQPGAYGQLIANTQTGAAVLVVAGLSPLEPGKVYEFWLITGDTPVGAGMFQVDAQGQAILQVPQNVTPGSFNAIGVSIEPEGGSQQPTGDIVMLGSIS